MKQVHPLRSLAQNVHSGFLASYANDAVSETLETIEWVSDAKMLDPLRQKEQARKSD